MYAYIKNPPTVVVSRCLCVRLAEIKQIHSGVQYFALLLRILSSLPFRCRCYAKSQYNIRGSVSCLCTCASIRQKLVKERRSKMCAHVDRSIGATISTVLCFQGEFPREWNERHIHSPDAAAACVYNSVGVVSPPTKKQFVKAPGAVRWAMSFSQYTHSQSRCFLQTHSTVHSELIFEKFS